MTILAIGVSAAGCSESLGRNASQTDAVSAREAIRVEVDDHAVDLPTATRVSCEADSAGTYKLVWTSSKYLVSRHPLYQDPSSTQIRMTFRLDPPAVSSASLQVHVRNNPVNLAWTGEADADQPPATLVSVGKRGYTFVGTLAELGSAGTAHFVRVEFVC